jgi:hypothetical protein
MSDRALIRAICRCAVLLLSFGATALQAQSQAEYRTRVQQLVPLWKSVTAEARRVDSLRARDLPTDTVRVGPLTILSDSGLGDLTRTSATRAVAALDARFGTGVDALRSRVFALVRRGPATPGKAIVGLGEIGATGTLVRVNELQASPELVAESWAARGSEALTRQLGGDFGHWLGNVLPVDSADADQWVGVRIDLVTSRFQVARACYVGDIDACERALGITGLADPIQNWFSPMERREFLYRIRYRLQHARPAEFDACFAHGSDSACLALGALVLPSEIPPALGPASRQNLARLAMTIGGTQSFARMLTAPSAVGARLQAASGISTDSLVRRWRAAVLTTEAPHTTMTAGLAVMSLFWVATCGALALGSSRWR